MGQDVAQFFTRARRIPVLVGRLPDGAALPGGPYTLTQVLLGAGSVLVLAKTTALWAHFGGLTNLLVGAGVVAAVVWFSGRLPTSGRNPISWLGDAVSLYGRPRSGLLRDRPMRVARPHLVRHVMVVSSPPPSSSSSAVDPAPVRSVATEAAAEPLTKPVVEPVAEPVAEPAGAAVGTVSHRPLVATGVSQLLASTITRRDA
ncbi:hypothetical protein [uncultured Cellulomonas sp.]|uniref:hypothetical protein n=1 Tax=uncultured Cellulomonas sp. TaxID=189682 RepID=UPI002617C31E|nr:hypothetical protein [uncultured Cellulomonas sp.]